MSLTIENVTYSSDDILFINTAHKVMGLYEIDIYIKSQEDPLILQYEEESYYNNMVNYIKNNISIA